MIPKPLIIVATAMIAVVAFYIGANFYRAQQAEEREAIAASSTDAINRDNLPSYGNAAARVTITEFLDPGCEACRAFHPIVKQIVNSSFGQVRVQVRYAAFHEGSDQAVRILEAARAQDKFWPVLEQFYETQQAWAAHGAARADMLWQIAGGAGLDVEAARPLADSPEVDAILARESADIETLQVRQTPTFFVNGKPLEDFGVDQLRALVDEQLRATAPGGD